MQFDAFFAFVQSSPLATLLDGSRYISMAIQIVHILGFTFLLALALAFNLRVLRLALRELPLAELAATLQRPFLIALGVAVLAGILLFLPRAVAYAGNTPFVWKMGLLIAASLSQLVLLRTLSASPAVEATVTSTTPRRLPGSAALAAGLPAIAWYSAAAGDGSRGVAPTRTRLSEAALPLRAAALLAVLLWLATGIAGRAIGFM